MKFVAPWIWCISLALSTSLPIEANTRNSSHQGHIKLNKTLRAASATERNQLVPRGDKNSNKNILCYLIFWSRCRLATLRWQKMTTYWKFYLSCELSKHIMFYNGLECKRCILNTDQLQLQVKFKWNWVLYGSHTFSLQSDAYATWLLRP